MKTNKNLTIEFLEGYDKWMEVLALEVLSHIDFQDKQVVVEIFNIDERGMELYSEIITGVDEDGNECCEEMDGFLRCWVDEVFPKFCVSYILYIDGEEKDSGAYQIVERCGEGVCIPI